MMKNSNLYREYKNIEVTIRTFEAKLLTGIIPATNLPSQETGDFFIFASALKSTYPQERAGHSGKYLIFRNIGEPLDTAWITCLQALDSGKLGRRIKVSTALPNKHASSPDKGVICVYTYNGEDEKDRLRIRAALYDLGFTAKLPWKLDALAGVAYGPGTSSYSE
jgi:Basophilic leukemia-expressed protein Bles03